MLDRMAGQTQAELQALTDHHGSAPELLAHVLSPPPGSQPHGPGAHHQLFADAATLAADPDLAEPARRAARAVADHLAGLVRHGQANGAIRADADPEAAAWLLLSVLSARPLRAAAMPDQAHLEDGVAALALQALIPPTPAPAPTGHGHHDQADYR